MEEERNCRIVKVRCGKKCFKFPVFDGKRGPPGPPGPPGPSGPVEIRGVVKVIHPNSVKSLITTINYGEEIIPLNAAVNFAYSIKTPQRGVDTSLFNVTPFFHSSVTVETTYSKVEMDINFIFNGNTLNADGCPYIAIRGQPDGKFALVFTKIDGNTLRLCITKLIPSNNVWEPIVETPATGATGWLDLNTETSLNVYLFQNSQSNQLFSYNRTFIDESTTSVTGGNNQAPQGGTYNSIGYMSGVNLFVSAFYDDVTSSLGYGTLVPAVNSAWTSQLFSFLFPEYGTNYGQYCQVAIYTSPTLSQTALIFYYNAGNNSVQFIFSDDLVTWPATPVTIIENVNIISLSVFQNGTTTYIAMYDTNSSSIYFASLTGTELSAPIAIPVPNVTQVSITLSAYNELPIIYFVQNSQLCAATPSTAQLDEWTVSNYSITVNGSNLISSSWVSGSTIVVYTNSENKLDYVITNSNGETSGVTRYDIHWTASINNDQ